MILHVEDWSGDEVPDGGVGRMRKGEWGATGFSTETCPFCNSDRQVEK